MLKKYSPFASPPARWRADRSEGLTTGSGSLDDLLSTDDPARADQSESQALTGDNSRAGFPIALDEEFAPPHADPPTQQERLVPPPSAGKPDSSSKAVVDLTGSSKPENSAMPVDTDEQTETSSLANRVDSSRGNPTHMDHPKPASQNSLFLDATPEPLTEIPLSANSTLNFDSSHSPAEEYQTDQEKMPQNSPSNDASVVAGSTTSPGPTAENLRNVDRQAVDATQITPKNSNADPLIALTASEDPIVDPVPVPVVGDPIPAVINGLTDEPNQQPVTAPSLDGAQTAPPGSQPATSMPTNQVEKQTSTLQSQLQQSVTPAAADSAGSDSLYWLLLFWALLLVPIIVGVAVWQWLARREKPHRKHRLHATDDHARGEFKKSTRLSASLAEATSNSKQYNDDLVDAETSPIPISQIFEPTTDSESGENKMAAEKLFDDKAEELNFDFAEEEDLTVVHSDAMGSPAELLEDSANASEVMNLDAFDFGDNGPDDDSQLFGESKEERFDHPDETPSRLAPSADSVGETNDSFRQSPREISPATSGSATAAEKSNGGFISRIGGLFGKRKPLVPAAAESTLDITQTEEVVQLTSAPIENTTGDLPKSIGPINVSLTTGVESEITFDETDLNFDDGPLDDDEFKGRFSDSVESLEEEELDLQEPETRVEFTPASVARPLGMAGDWIENAPPSSHENQDSELLAELEALRAERTTLYQSLQASQQELAAFTQQQQQQLDELNLEQQQQRAERQQFEANCQLAEQQRLLEQRELQQQLDSALQEKQSLAGQMIDLQTLQSQLTNALSENQNLINQKTLVDQQLAERQQQENVHQLAEQQRLLEQRELQQRLDSALQEKQSFAGQMIDLQTLQTQLANALAEKQMFLAQLADRDQQLIDERTKFAEVSLPAMAVAAQPDNAAIDLATKQKFTKLYRAYERERKLRKESEQFLVDAEEQRDQLRAALQLAKREITDQPQSVIHNLTTAESFGAAPAARTPRPKTINMEDLTQIAGIGKAIRAKLNSLGIRNIQQIAAWSDEDVARVDQQLSLKSKIQKDKWIEQAQALIEKLATEENSN